MCYAIAQCILYAFCHECVCVGSCPDRLIHGPHPSYWVAYRSGWLWAAADRGLGTTEQLSVLDTQWPRHAPISWPPGPHKRGGGTMGCADTYLSF